ncbi:hypothetical protein ACJ72_03408 [Emergomyces africanus]|uniref:N-glycosylation protein EOS1 n=1 Tax=Emergomyces africanus TaxID=1955775 RepID=A0A1B7NZP4_9EURO|nr:hypothetical protein ACJ72_03408 [Emergomyces africanus]
MEHERSSTKSGFRQPSRPARVEEPARRTGERSNGYSQASVEKHAVALAEVWKDPAGRYENRVKAGGVLFQLLLLFIGLKGDAMMTWTAHSENICWLNHLDISPKYIQNANVSSTTGPTSSITCANLVRQLEADRDGNYISSNAHGCNSRQRKRLASSFSSKPPPSPSPHHAHPPQHQPRFRNALRSYRARPNNPNDPPPPFPSSNSSSPSTVASRPQASNTSGSTSRDVLSSLHPRVAVILGVDRRWYIPLLLCRGLSVLPAAWWGLRCAFTFLAELLRIRPHFWHEGWTAAIVRGAAADWDVERRFRVTEVALAIIWCSASAYLFYFFTDCMMSRWLLNYTPAAVVIRLLATNGLLAYLTSWILYLSGASSDPRLLLPAWISIASVLSFVYHITQRQINIKKETFATIYVFSIASFLSMCSLLLQLHLTRENEPEVPLFVMGTRILEICSQKIAEYGFGGGI